MKMPLECWEAEITLDVVAVAKRDQTIRHLIAAVWWLLTAEVASEKRPFR